MAALPHSARPQLSHCSVSVRTGGHGIASGVRVAGSVWIAGGGCTCGVRGRLPAVLSGGVLGTGHAERRWVQGGREGAIMETQALLALLLYERPRRGAVQVVTVKAP